MPNAILDRLRDETPRKDDRNILSFQHEGYIVLVGRNSFSNERLIIEHPHRTCIWMHALAARGSHIILCIHERPEPTETVLQYAAKLALDHSHSNAREVSMAFLKDIFKPEGGGVGVWKPSRQDVVEVL